MCCLPIAGSEQLNDKAADRPQAPQTGAGGKKALAEGCACRMARPHPQRPEPRRKAAQFINTGRPRLKSPLGRVHSGGLGGGDCASEGPLGQKQARTDPSPCQRGPLVDLAPRKLCPLPSDQALAGSQKGRENTISFPPRLASPTHGGFPSPLNPSQRPQPTSTPDALRIRGHAESWHAPFLPGHINPGVLTPPGEEGQCLQSPVWGAKCILLHLPGLEF